MYLILLGLDVLLCVGDEYVFVVIVFFNGSDVLLVDVLGSVMDVWWLCDLLCW